MPSSDNVIRLDFGARAQPKPEPKAACELSAQKLKMFTGLLEQGVVMLVLDATFGGVRVPAMLSQQRDLRLNFSNLYGIKDFEYDLEGVSATLGFSQGNAFCFVPWGAVFAMQSESSEKGGFWPESLPVKNKPNARVVPKLNLVSEKNHLND